MKVTIYKKEAGKYSFICTKLMGQELTFDKAATKQLKDDGCDGPGEFDLSGKYRMYGTKSKDGKYINFRIGIDKPKEPESKDDLPF